MADPKTDKKSPPPANVIAPPAKVFKWGEETSVSGKLMEPVIVSEQRYGRRTRIALDTCTLLLPARYGDAYARVPVGVKVTVSRAGAGRETTYTLAWD